MPLNYDGVSIALGEPVMAFAGQRPGPWYLYSYEDGDRGKPVGSAPRVDLLNCKFSVWRAGPQNELYAGVTGALTGFSDSITPSCEFYYVVVWDSESEQFMRAWGSWDIDHLNSVLLWDDGLIYAERTPDIPLNPDSTAEQEANEAFAITCPECGAEPGVRCPGRRTSGLHNDRLLLSPTLQARTGYTTGGVAP
ncbi:MAG: hypothetical protein K1X67_19660 [Fimbriimonadaceae bacterium]|nr:hypothetical protein [Fimbriimonadaceae bacterium]